MDSSPIPDEKPRIQALPKQVVDRIAAGEVVQRPASVIKELIENSLDAGATSIDVQCSGGGMRLLSITDDGHGIHPEDLKLAATRFATSKLKQFNDLALISTFGFRGEALASASMVGRLSIVSRKRPRNGSKKSECAYKMSYEDGAPTGRAMPSAGKEGTCVKLQDLFYNLPSRKRAFEGTRKESEEYQRILNIAQRYAVLKAKDGIGIVCRKKGGTTDLNTASMGNVKKLKLEMAKRNSRSIEDTIDASTDTDDHAKLQDNCTRDVIAHIYGSDVSRELLSLQCHEGDVYKVSLAALEAMKNESSSEDARRNQTTVLKEGNSLVEGLVMGSDFGATIAKESEEVNAKSSQYSFAYKAQGLITNGSYCVSKSSSAFLLFINGRLVESMQLKKAVESVYLDMLPKGAKPFIYLSLELPGPHLDVNVHPTKREVAFLHEDRLCDALTTSVRDILRSNTTSRTFYAQTLFPDERNGTANPQPKVIATNTKLNNETKENVQQEGIEDDESESEINSGAELSDDEILEKSVPLKRDRFVNDEENPKKKRKAYDPKNLIRTIAAAHQGALEPFLVATQPRDSSSQSQRQTSFSGTSEANQQVDEELSCSNRPSDTGRQIGFAKEAIMEHTSDCEFASTTRKIDLSIPGAFASICRCQVEQAASLPRLPKTLTATVIRPKKIVPTECSYLSIETLRKDVELRAHGELTEKLRESVFVGCINRRRCLFQSGIELLMVNFYELSKELFFQLSVYHFGGFQMAKLGNGGIDVKVLIEQALQFEDCSKSFTSLSQSACPNTNLSQEGCNSELAKQAATCLSEHAEMLNDYFSIQLKIIPDKSEAQSDELFLMLTGLPIILDGHSPAPHALPAFLLRLATEVDWSEERPCFEGVCTELARYYAEIPLDEVSREKTEKTKLQVIGEREKKFVQHTLFPALRYLLVIPREFASDGSFCKLALLSKLYKVFERC
jgi:DNA mismatch repair protein MLH1